MVDTEQKMFIEQRVSNEAPTTGVAYLLWFFLGFFSIHRFYMGLTNSAILQLVLNFCLGIGLIWTVIDAFLIPGLIKTRRDEIRNQVTLQILAEDSSRVGRIEKDMIEAAPTLMVRDQRHSRPT